MANTIRELLAKQRAELEEEMKRRGETPSTTQLASIAPASLGRSDAALPKVGDRWEYRYIATNRTTRDLVVEITGASQDGILEASTFGGASRARAHSNAVDLYFNDYWDFSPYLAAFRHLKEGEQWPGIVPQNFTPCRYAGAQCRIDAKVVGRERVVTPAGTFDATKVVLEFNGRSVAGGSYSGPTWRQYTYWYADDAKRVVKATVRTPMGNILDSDYDLELVSYKLN